MNITVEELDGGRVALTVEVSVEETKPYLDAAANRLAHKHQIPGFRPGKAPVSVIKQKFGEAELYEEVAQDLVPKTLYKALQEKKIDSVGQPEISVEKLAPDNPIIYKATLAKVPEVTLGAWKDISVKKEEIKVEEKDVDTMIEEFRNMQAKEALVNREAKKDDKVEVNFEVKLNGAVIEGGKGTKYPLILGKGSMIPGFEDNIIGMKATEKKTFKLKFPKPYGNEQLEGKEAEFDVELIGVQERTLPEANDEWAKQMLGKTLKEMREMLKENLAKEKEAKQRQQLEQDVMDKVIEKTTFSELPKLLLENEAKRMLAEMKDDVAKRGMEWNKYLESMKKKEDELEKEFAPHAEKRVKGALVLRALGEDMKSSATEEEIEKELESHKQQYQGNEKAESELEKPEFKDYVKRILINRKTIDNLLSLLVK